MNQNNSITVVVSTSTTTTDGTGNEGVFQVAVTYGAQSWEVKHSRDEFKSLSDALFLEMSDEAFPKLPEDVSSTEAQDFQNYLISVIGNLNENLWYKEVIMAFLDEEPNKSYLTQVQLSKMSKQINYLLSKTAENEQKFLDIEAKSAKLDKIVEYLTSSMNAKPTAAVAPTPEPPKLPQPPPKLPPQQPAHQKLAPPGLSASNGPPGLSAAEPEKQGLTHAGAASFFNLPSSAAASPADQLRKSPPVAVSDSSLFQELEMGGSALEDSLEGPPGIALGSVAKSAVAAVFDEDDFDISLLDNARLGGANNLLLDDDLLRLSGDYQAKWDAAAKTGSGAGDGSLAPPKVQGHTTGPSSKYMARESVSAQDEPLHYDKTIDEILDALQPHEAQVQYRQSAVGLLKKQSRLALSSTTYEVGLHALHCFLPTDTIKLSVVISKNQVPYWHTSLGERLKLMEGGVVPADDAQYPDIYDDYKPMMNHAVRAVSFLNEKDVFKVVCAVDALEVEISANARTDICMLAFLEEVSEMVGLDNLFKRSLLLIRAWWVYETASYVGCPIKHYLSDFSLCIMVCAIFNQYHAQIGSPLQALCLFLTEYSGYDGSTHAITLHGIIPFKTPSSAQAAAGNARADHLINTQFIDKYRKLFNLQSAVDAEGTAAADEAKGKYAQQPYYSIVNKNILNFTRFGFNVVHPFTSANMITEKLSARRLQLIAKAFQIGAMNLSVVLKQSNDNMKSARDLINSYFPAVLSKFSNNYRPDAIGNSIILPAGFETAAQFTNSRDIMNISIDKIWQNILYCNFIIESIVSESAILTFFLDNLALKGALPVGEIGKMLSEVSSIPNLSQKLKDKFGGLKKFLERFQDLFVFSNDHPFNPHVILRNTLTAEQLEAIEQGGSFPLPAGSANSAASPAGAAQLKNKQIGGPVSGSAATSKPKGSGLLMGPGVTDFDESDALGGLMGFDTLGSGAGSDSMSLFNSAMNAASLSGPNSSTAKQAKAGFPPVVGGGMLGAPGPSKFPTAPGLGAYGAPPGGLNQQQLVGGPGSLDKKIAMKNNQGGFNIDDSPVLRGIPQPKGFSATAPAFNPGASPFASSSVVGSKPKQQLGSAALNGDFLLDGGGDFDYAPLVPPQRGGGGSSMLSQLRENTTELNLMGGLGGGNGKQQQQMGLQQQQRGMDNGRYDQQYQQQQQMYGGDEYGQGQRGGQQSMQQQRQPMGQQQQGLGQRPGGPPLTQQQLYHQQQMQMQQGGGGQQRGQQPDPQGGMQPQYNSFKTYRNNM